MLVVEQVLAELAETVVLKVLMANVVVLEAAFTLVEKLVMEVQLEVSSTFLVVQVELLLVALVEAAVLTDQGFYMLEVAVVVIAAAVQLAVADNGAAAVAAVRIMMDLTKIMLLV